MTGKNVDEKLAVNKYAVDEDTPHIVLAAGVTADAAGAADAGEGVGAADSLAPDARFNLEAEFDKLVTCCPAALYQRDAEGNRTFDYAGCLECGTCRILCGDTIVEKWAYPQGGMGVSYRFG